MCVIMQGQFVPSYILTLRLSELRIRVQNCTGSDLQAKTGPGSGSSRQEKTVSGSDSILTYFFWFDIKVNIIDMLSGLVAEVGGVLRALRKTSAVH